MTMLTIQIQINAAAAALVGLAREGIVEARLSDADVEAMTPAERQELGRLIDATQPAPVLTVQVAGERQHRPWTRGDAADVIEGIQWAGRVRVELTAAYDAACAERKARENEAVERQREEWARAYAERGASALVVERYSDWHCIVDGRCPSLMEVGQSEVARLRAERTAAQEARGGAARQDRLDWIEAHGSAHLQRLVADGLGERRGTLDVYSSERLTWDRAALAAELPGWEFELDAAERLRDPAAVPTPEAYRLLDAARSYVPDCRLAELVGDDDDDEDGGEVVTWCAAASFRGRDIVLRGVA